MMALAVGTPAFGQPNNFLRIGDGSSRVDSINPFGAVNGFSLLTVRTLYPFLVEYDLEGRITSDLAENYAISDDGLTWTFNIAAGATWNDGTPLTASDAEWTINTMVAFRDGATARFSSFIANIVEAVAKSDTELTIKFAEVAATSGDALAQIPILPEHIWAPIAGEDGSGLSSFGNTDPVSAGPFEIVRFTPPESIIFKRYDNFYGTAPKLDGFGVVFYSNDDAAVNALKAGDIDAAYEVPATAMSTLAGSTAVNVVVTEGRDTVFFEINSRTIKETAPELKNPRVREAIDLAIDKDEIIDVVTDGLGARSASFLPPSAQYWYNDELEMPGHDVDKANAILDELGYAMREDGIRVANGMPMIYRFLYPDVATGAPRVITMIANMLADIGIKVEPQASDYPSYAAAIFRDDYLNFEFGLDDFEPDNDPNRFLGIPTCAQFNQANETGYCNKEYDALFAEQAVTLDTQKRREIVRELQAIIARDRPIIPIYAAPTISAQRSNVRDLPPSPLIINHISKQFLMSTTVEK